MLTITNEEFAKTLGSIILCSGKYSPYCYSNNSWKVYFPQDFTQAWVYKLKPGVKRPETSM